MNSTLNFIDGHQISYAVAGACALTGRLLRGAEPLRIRDSRGAAALRRVPVPNFCFSGLRGADARERARRGRRRRYLARFVRRSLLPPARPEEGSGATKSFRLVLP